MNNQETTMDVCDAIVKVLESVGIDAIFGGSGAGDTDIMLALSKSEKIKTIIARNEQAASFMACGYGMFSDKLGVCFCSSGPGAVNIISGLCVALSDSIPVLAFSGYEASEGIGKGGLGETSGLNRTPDSQKIFEACTKKTYLLTKGEDICDMLEDAINTAFEGRPGPVHIHLPSDVTHDEVPDFRDIKINIQPVSGTKNQIDALVNALEKFIKGKKKVLAIIGYGCFRSQAEKELREFLENFQIPFLTTMDGKGILPDSHPLCLGMTGAAGDPGAKQALMDAEVVLALGNSFSKWQVWKWEPSLYDNKILIQINIDKNAINRVYKADYAIVSDIKPAIKEINEGLKKRISVVEPVKPTYDKFYDRKITYTGNKIHPAELSREISRHLPENSILLGDAGAHMLWLAVHTQLSKGQKYQNPGIFGPMASHVNASIGMYFSDPSRRVIVGCGDGSYLMAGFELTTAVEHKVPVIWIIFNNSEFNIIKMIQMRKFNGQEVFNHFLNPDFVKYAEACGAKGYRVEKVDEFSKAFQEALALNEPVIIDVIVDPDIFPAFGLFQKGKELSARVKEDMPE
jgi:acetolactate synthase I/II/III large subunit